MTVVLNLYFPHCTLIQILGIRLILSNFESSFPEIPAPKPDEFVHNNAIRFLQIAISNFWLMLLTEHIYSINTYFSVKTRRADNLKHIHLQCFPIKVLEMVGIT